MLAIMTAVGVTAGTADTGAEFETTWAQTDDSQSNETRIRHENPDSVTEAANPSALERRFSGALTDRLAESARSIDAGEYDTAQELLADRYDEQLTLYMEVYRTAVTSDLERVEQQEALFAETAALQAQYAERLSEYRQVAAEYESAREANDRERAQRRARELSNITGDLRRIEQSLTPRYQAIAATTDGSTTTASRVVSTTTTETTQRTTERVQETYTATGVSAEASPSGSFADPVRVTGQLTAANDDPPSGTVVFRVNDRTVTTTVEPDGTFVLPYRPTAIPDGPAQIPVSYVPDDAALYLPSQTTVSTTVTQSTPTVSIDDASANGQVGSPVTAAGRVTVDDTSVSNTSVTLRTGERTLAETQTDGDGNYRFDTRLPANVSAGARTLSISVGGTGTALAPVSETTDLTVEETQTQLTLSAVRSEDAVNIAGRLVTDEETGVGGQDVVVSLNGDQRATVRTDADGSYQASVEFSNATNASSAVSVQAAFDGGETSLTSATVNAALTPPGDGPLPADTQTLTILAAGIAMLTAGGLAVYRYRRESGDPSAPAIDAVQPRSIDPAVVATPGTGDVDGVDSDPQSSSDTMSTEDDS